MTCYEIWMSHDKIQFACYEASSSRVLYALQSTDTDDQPMVCLASFTTPSWRQARQLYAQLVRENR